MKNKKIFTTTLLLTLFLTVFPSLLSADTITPFVNTVSLNQAGRSRESFQYSNESNIQREILLQAYGYNIITEDIDADVPILLLVDTDTFVINPSETKDIPYEVVLPENLETGTYFNILILEPVSQAEESSITTHTSASQIVRIDVYPKDSEDNKIADIPADISLEVITKGIPYIKAAQIKYTYTNTSNYILQPEGELQIFNEKQKTEPVYIKINEEEKVLQKGEMLTEIFEIQSWSIYDLIYERVVLGRFYNGVDGQYQGEQLRIENFKDELIVIGAVVLFISILSGESSKAKGRKIPKDYDEETEDEEE